MRFKSNPEKFKPSAAIAQPFQSGFCVLTSPLRLFVIADVQAGEGVGGCGQVLVVGFPRFGQTQPDAFLQALFPFLPAYWLEDAVVTHRRFLNGARGCSFAESIARLR